MGMGLIRTNRVTLRRRPVVNHSRHSFRANRDEIVEIVGEHGDWWYVRTGRSHPQTWMYVQKSDVITRLDGQAAAERIFDHTKRAAIFDRLAQEPFRASDWTGKDATWRRTNVVEFLEYIKSELGLSSGITISWSQYNGNYVNGFFAPNLIRLNPNNLSRQTLWILIHEARHAYQYEVVDEPNRFPHVTLQTRNELRRRFPRDWDIAAPPYRNDTITDPLLRAREFPEWDAVHFEGRGPELAEQMPPVVPERYRGSW